ncbi:MAG TPA: hypothetical protein VM223_14595 [Planctomycetota bacterium]|nr:hypothetical protein [Planctomycetota bacterium]
MQFVSPDLDRADIFDIGIVDDSAVAPAATTDLAALVAAADPGVRGYHQVVPGVQASVLSVELAAAGDGALTINGVVFPYDGAPTPGTGEWDDAAALVIEINTLLPNLLAAAVGTVVTIRSAVAGEQTITLTSTVTAVIDADVVTLEGVAYLEVDASELVPGATTIAVVIDNTGTTGTITASATLVRGDARYVPVPQAVA